MRLSAAELTTLQTSKLSINIAPTGDADGEYRLTPGSTVGAVEIGDLSVIIRPKIGIPQLLSMACYAMSKFKPSGGTVQLPAGVRAAGCAGVGARLRLPAGRFRVGCCMATAWRRNRSTRCADASCSPSSCEAGSEYHCRSRCATTSSPTTSWRTGWLGRRSTFWAGCGCVRNRPAGSWAGLRACSKTSRRSSFVQSTYR